MKVSWGMIKDRSGGEHGFGVWVNLDPKDDQPSEGDQLEATSKAGKSSYVTLFELLFEKTNDDGTILQLWSILGRGGKEPISKAEIEKINQQHSQSSSPQQPKESPKPPLKKNQHVPNKNKGLFDLEQKSDEVDMFGGNEVPF